MLQKLKTLLATRGRFRLSVHVTPKSRQNQLGQVEISSDHQISVKVKITGVPEKGQVNENLLRFLSKNLDLPQSSLKIISGFTSRHKIIEISTNALL